MAAGFRRASRLIVAGDRPSSAAIAVCDQFSSNRSAITIRSSTDK
ncbi:hypothetical protein BKA14_006562 [Actinoplanes abujensis]|uniref:Uncharacterized protein n=1 Tax=Paractinoplanes abujensis TaxID=882441 RepID=A0A7W7G5B2_9ACTN|nr:hypothetical protein [Actinoplanes abujensis]MBB4696414.1 hypothetical protein [Actinoplanes abujensis]